MWLRLVLMIPLMIACVGCGDSPGYEVLVENRSQMDVVVVMAGTGYADATGGPVSIKNPSFISRSGGAAAATSWIDAPWVGEGWRPAVSVYATDCTLVKRFDVQPGSHDLTIEAAGGVRIEDHSTGARLPPGTKQLPPAVPGCSCSGHLTTFDPLTRSCREVTMQGRRRIEMRDM